ncbi:hypothetical protein QQ054_31035 [Oscillatoria amoena NRMC-F 0135]|nr:hypothetical protein [Oscillatoria amoena NRMC-F 0135]
MIKKVQYNGWDAVELSNPSLTMVVTTSVGPRVICVKTPEGPNFMMNHPAQQGLTGGEQWRIYGGHRLWHSPEADPRTYAPDNDPVDWKEIPGGIKLIQAVEKTTGLQKEIEIILDPASAKAVLTHRIYNRGYFDVEFAPWCLSVCAPGGVAYLPFAGKARPNTFLNDRILSLWPYTDLSDPRLGFRSSGVLLRQDPKATTPCKIGATSNYGWGAYVLGQEAFIKTIPVQSLESGSPVHPDNNVAWELYTCDLFLELETLGALEKIAPGQFAQHQETWEFLPMSQTNDPRISEIKAALPEWGGTSGKAF